MTGFPRPVNDEIIAVNISVDYIHEIKISKASLHAGRSSIDVKLPSNFLSSIPITRSFVVTWPKKQE